MDRNSNVNASFPQQLLQIEELRTVHLLRNALNLI